MTEAFICTSCKGSARKLNATKSRLMPTMIFLCDNCRKLGYEPRSLVVLAARNRNARANIFVKAHRFIGKEILAKEIL